MSKTKTTNRNKSSKQSAFCRFSIVIANYNYAGHVAQAIQSSLAQNYPTDCFEVIVVDDGSTDNSRAVIAELASKNKNLRVIQQTNLGQAAAFY
ncbi:MAG: glycosyltransferase family 2 protein, partial [Methylotenera sp.]